MDDLTQRAVDNLLLDSFTAIVLIAVSVFFLRRLARMWRVSALPILVVMPVLSFVGSLLYLPLSPLYLRNDGEFYQAWGFSLAATWTTGAPVVVGEPLIPGKGFLPLIIGVMSVLVGPVTLAVIALNVAVLGLCLVLIQKATILIGNQSPRWSIVAAFLTCSPILLWGPSLLRESIFWLGSALGILAISYAARNRYVPAFFLSGFSTLTLMAIRPDVGLFIVYGIFFMLTFLILIVGPKRSWLRSSIASLILLALAVSFPPVFEIVRPSISTSLVKEISQDLSKASVTTAFEPNENSPALSDQDWCSPDSWHLLLMCEALSNLPRAVFGPFPWEYGAELIWLVAGASTLHFLLVLALSCFHIFVSRGHRWPSSAIFILAWGTVLVFSSVLTSYGILIRFRAVSEIMLMPLALSGALTLAPKIRKWVTNLDTPGRLKYRER